MGKVLMEITMSLDGYTTGSEVSAEAHFGRGGERLHEWMFAGKSATEAERWQTDHFSTIGAVIIGRRMADLGIGPWGEEPVFHAPCFVVTHRPAETIVKKGGTSYIFVTEGIDAAMAQAKAAAGAQEVMVEGGADIDPNSSTPGSSTRSACTSRPSSSAPDPTCSPAYARTCGWSRPRRPTARLPRT